MSSEMVVRVAKAMLKVARPNGGGDWRDFYPAARANIEAMREPTVVMLEAAAVAAHHAELGDSLGLVRWQAMIDAALKDTP